MKYPNIIKMSPEWVLEINGPLAAGSKLPDGRYVPARPVGYPTWRARLRATWLVFTGRADALLWVGQ